MDFESMKAALVRAADAAGLSQYEIYYQAEEELSAETLEHALSAFASGYSGGICFRCIVDGKMGYASSELMTEDAMKELVHAAISNARCIDSEDEVFIFEGSLHYASIENNHPQLADAATVRSLALELQEKTYATDGRVGEGTQSMALSATKEIRLCNSCGLSLYNRVGFTGAYVNPIVREGEEAQESFEFELGESVETLGELPSRAVARALGKLGAVEIPSGEYDVLFDGRQFRQFLSVFSPVFSAKNARMGLSLLKGKEGEVVAAPCVTVTDDPMREGSPMQTPFDGEGVATSKKNVIENGVLKTLLYDLTTAKWAGVESTGNGQRGSYAAPVAIAPYHLSIVASDASEEELLAAVGEGIYLTECKGFHAGANAVTGDFSIESAGFMIRDGKLAEPIKSFTVAGNFFDVLKRIERIGNEVKWGSPTGFTTYGSPDLLIRGMSVAGK